MKLDTVGEHSRASIVTEDEAGGADGAEGGVGAVQAPVRTGKANRLCRQPIALGTLGADGLFS
jgi:hypothetical protein